MAYNMQNILVNLSKTSGGGGGGQIPALQLAVSQLQVSMADVKSSVANVSAQVEQIKATLASLKGYTESGSIVGSYNGSNIIRKVFNYDSPITIGYNSWTDTGISVSDNNIGTLFKADAVLLNDQCVPMTATMSLQSGNVGCQITRNGTDNTYDMIILEYVEAASNNQKKKGGKK